LRRRSLSAKAAKGLGSRFGPQTDGSAEPYPLTRREEQEFHQGHGFSRAAKSSRE
jgi:hypothetical protein